ncbi:MAG TPA: protein kinase [Chitinispirillaceae bacterium]|jgi:serine/threonine protein kinase|nr:protein kinase [Chitinispirillaceae bacterium]
MEKLIGEVVGGCRIEELIGKGGMGVVYRAHHLALDIPVAVKILQPTLSLVNDKERFLREARTTARLRNPYIVGVLNVGCEKGLHFIVMEYVEGKNLLDIITKRKKIPVSEAVEIAAQVLEALDAAFKQGIVHRDIKPENIIVDKEGKVRLTDLGLARVCGDISLTQTSVSLGSPYYIAPEQAENPRSTDHRADLYSLGCTIFHMISGSPPYCGESFVEVILDHIRKPVPSLQRFERSVNLSLSEFVKKMMAKSPEKRYGTPAEALVALREAVSEKTAGSRGERKNSRYLQTFAKMAIFMLVTAAVFLLYRNGHLLNAGKFLLNIKNGLTRGTPQTLKDSLQFINGQNLPLDQFQTNRINSLHKAVIYGSVEDVRFLLESGADPNAADSQGNSPLHYALKRGDLMIIRLLIGQGAKLNQRDRFDIDAGNGGVDTDSDIDAQ